LILRDEESAAVLADAGAPTPFWIGADIAWSLTGDVPRDAPFGTRIPTITIALSHLAGDRRFLGNLAAAVRPTMATHSVQLQPWQVGANGRDAELAEELGDLLETDVKVLDAPDSLAEAAATFAGDDLVIGLRFHALVAAGMAGTRFLAVAHEPKLAGLSRRLDQVSVPAHATAEVLRGALVHALDHDPVSPGAVQAQIVGARRSLDLMRLLLDDAAVEDPHTVAGLPLSNGSGTW
jgi:polysaccharide pyruvyl transferase WcaK-like protein